MRLFVMPTKVVARVDDLDTVARFDKIRRELRQLACLLFLRNFMELTLKTRVGPSVAFLSLQWVRGKTLQNNNKLCRVDARQVF